MASAAVVAAALFAAGCGNQMYALPTAASGARPRVEGLRAAAVDVDITPPVGLSLYGHGLEARLGVGVLSHLRCRGFVFEKDVEALAWLSCDLQSISLTLHRRVAELVRARTPLGTDRIVLSAVHTHAGPGHIFEGRAYTSALGGTRDPAYDQRVVDFLAKRIADAIVDAAGRTEPAAVRSGSSCLLGLTRNRALAAFFENGDVARELGCDGDDPKDAGHRYVDRRLVVLRVDRAADPAAPLGLMAVFSIHGTGMPNTNELYHGDLFEFAALYCEAVLGAKRTARGSPVCAIANGAEGDVSPDWNTQGEAEARGLGERLGAYVVRAFQNLERAAPDAPELAARYLELTFPGADAGSGRRLCAAPEIGAPSGGGAPDGMTRLRFFEQFNPGMIHPGYREPCAAPRISVLGLAPSMLKEAEQGLQFPARAPMEWLRIGDQRFLAVPVEPTTLVGARLEAAADAAAGSPGLRRTKVVGLTNGYVSYVATEAEYQRQYYEGASTIYGKHTAKFLEQAATALAKPQPPPLPAGGAALPAALARSPKVPSAWETSGSSDPNVTAPALHVGDVSHLYVSPSPVGERWPGGLDVDAACLLPGREVAAPAGVEITAAYDPLDGAWVLEARWPAPAELPLCGGAVAAVYTDGPRGRGALKARVRTVDALLGAAPTPAGPCATSRKWKARHRASGFATGFDALGDAGELPADDAHALVRVWYEFPSGPWHARFRDPGDGHEGEPFRLRLRASRDTYFWTTAVVRPQRECSQ